jgi:hypothetical protein
MRTLKPKWKTLVATAATSLLVISAGCNSNNAGSSSKEISSAPVTIPNSPRSILAIHADVSASANNATDLAGAQPESAISSARDVDLNGDAAAGQPLTYETLGQMVHKFPVTVEDRKDSYLIRIKAKTEDNVDWTFPITVSLSQDQSIVWIDCTLQPIDKNGSPNTQLLMDILSANSKMGTSFYTLDSSHNLVLQQAMNNVGITPASLGRSLKFFFDSLKATEPLFKNIVGVAGGDSGGSNPFQ